MDNIFEETDFGDRFLTVEGEEVIFLSEKDGIYYCGLRGYWESIPYDATGKCMITEIKGIDVSDGRLDIEEIRTFTTELIDSMTVEDFMELINDPQSQINPKAHVIVNHYFAPTCFSYEADGEYFHIAASRLSPNPYMEERKKKYGKYYRR